MHTLTKNASGELFAKRARGQDTCTLAIKTSRKSWCTENDWRVILSLSRGAQTASFQAARDLNETPSLNWPTYFSSSSSFLNMDRKPNVVELFILGPSMARMALSWVARQRMVRSVTTSTTPESRTDQHKETCAETSERCLNFCQVHLKPDSIRSLAHFSDFSGSFASRQ